MKLFELSKWKGSQSALRVVVVLSLLGAGSFVMGACASRQPLTEQQAGGPPDSSCVVSDNPQLEVRPDEERIFKLCVATRGRVTLKNSTAGEVHLCFRLWKREGEWESKSPFDGREEDPDVVVPKEPQEMIITSTPGIYEFTTRKGSACTWHSGGLGEGLSGTLEVVTGGGEHPDQR